MALSELEIERAQLKLVELEKRKLPINQTLLDLQRESNEIQDRISLCNEQLGKLEKEQELIIPKGERVDTSIANFFWKKTEAVNILEESELPDDYFKTKPATTSVDKTAIKKALADGTEVPGAEMKENFNFQINIKK